MLYLYTFCVFIRRHTKQQLLYCLKNLLNSLCKNNIDYKLICYKNFEIKNFDNYNIEFRKYYNHSDVR